MVFAQISTLVRGASSAKNATTGAIDQRYNDELLEGVVNMQTLNNKAYQYFMELCPLFMVLVAVAAVLYVVRCALLRAYIHGKRSLYSTVTIKNNDDTFVWITKYMQDKGIIANDTQLKCGLKKKKDDDWWVSIKTDMFATKNGREKPDVDFQPGPGMHALKHKGKTLWIMHRVGETLMVGEEKLPQD